MYAADLLSHHALLTPEREALIASPIFYATA